MSPRDYQPMYAGIDTAAALDVFVRLSYERGPAVRELQEELGLVSSSVAHYRIKALLAAGWIEPVPCPYPVAYSDRGYRLTPAGREAAEASSAQRKDSA